jgi:hypothetical protein
MQAEQRFRPERLGPWRLLLVLLALLAANAQQLVAHTHFHSGVAALAEVAAGPAAPEEGSGRHDDCLLCQIAAHAAAAAPPSVQQLLPVASQILVSAVPAGRRSIVVTRPAHAWQSRGPPAA